MLEGEAGAVRVRPVTESMAVLAGTAINGVAAYLYIAIGTRTYGDVAMAPVAVLWTFWAVSVALFMFPLQHWAIRQIAIDGDTRGVAGTVPRVAGVVTAAAAVLALVAWLASERLFDSSGAVWALLVFAVTAGSAFSGLQRGVLSGLGRYYATAANIAGENLLRLALAVVVAATVDDVVWFAGVLAVGPLVAVFWPETFRLPFRDGVRHRAFAFLGGLAGGILVAQLILHSGPVVLQAIGGTDVEVTALFLSLALFRAPYLLALGVATRMTAPLTRVVMGGDRTRVRRLVVICAGATAGLAVPAAIVGYSAGPWVIDLVFAPDTATSPGVVSAVASGSALALGGLALILVLLAEGRTRDIQAAWGGALVVGALLITLGGDDLTARVVTAFVVAQTVAVVAMTTLALRGRTLEAAA